MAGMLSGCGGSSENGNSSGNASDTGSAAADGAADGTYNISLIVKLTDGHFNRIMAGARAYDEEHDNVSVEILSPSSATAYDEQMNMIETALGNPSSDAVVIAPLQSSTASTLVANTDKVIVALDTNFDSEKKSTFVGTGNRDAAKNGGAAAVEEAKKRGIEQPIAVILTGVQGDETHDARMEGYREGIESAGGSVLEVQYCDAMADRAATAMESIMQKYPEGVDIVCSTNDDMVMAAAKVVKDSNNPAFDDAVLCGFDGNQPAIEAVRDGAIVMDVVQLGYDMGYKAIEAAVNVLEGGVVEDFIDSGAEIVTPETVDAYISSMKDRGVWDE